MIYISKLRPTVRVIEFNNFGDLMTVINVLKDQLKEEYVLNGHSLIMKSKMVKNRKKHILITVLYVVVIKQKGISIKMFSILI